jgi:hypothetical protein
MAASSALVIERRSDCDLFSMWVIVLTRGLATPAPRVGLPFISDPSVYPTSLGFYFRLWVTVCRMLGVACGFVGVGVSVLTPLLSMLRASSYVMLVIVVFDVLPYSWVRSVVRMS